jgi:hypothetical protein
VKKRSVVQSRTRKKLPLLAGHEKRDFNSLAQLGLAAGLLFP